MVSGKPAGDRHTVSNSVHSFLSCCPVWYTQKCGTQKTLYAGPWQLQRGAHHSHSSQLWQNYADTPRPQRSEACTWEQILKSTVGEVTHAERDHKGSFHHQCNSGRLSLKGAPCFYGKKHLQ